MSAPEIVVPCDTQCLEKIRDFVRTRAAEAGLSRNDVGRLVLAADEVSSNIIRHSYHFDWKHKIALAWHADSERIAVEIRDDSPVPYLPAMTDFDLSTKIKLRQTNGYGKYLIRNAVDDVQYETIPGSHNQVTLVKYRKGGDSKGKGIFINPHELTRSRSHSLRVLFDVSAELGRQGQTDDLIRLFLYTVMGHLSTQPVVLLRAKQEADPFSVIGQMGLSRRIAWNELKLPRHGWVVETLWAHQGPFLTAEFRKLHAPPKEVEVLEDLQSRVLVPVFVLNRLRGVLSLGEKRNRYPFSEDDLSLVNLLAGHTLLLLEGLEGKTGRMEPGGALREAVRGAIADLVEASRSQGVSIELKDSRENPHVTPETGLIRRVVLTLLTHILYLAQEGTPIEVGIGSGSKEAWIRIDYSGRRLQFEKGQEGYNPLIDQLLEGSLKLTECRKAILAEGGGLLVEPGRSGSKGSEGEISVTVSLPLAPRG